MPAKNNEYSQQKAIMRQAFMWVVDRFGFSGWTMTLNRSTAIAVRVDMDRVPEKAPTNPYVWQPGKRRRIRMVNDCELAILVTCFDIAMPTTIHYSSTHPVRPAQGHCWSCYEWWSGFLSSWTSHLAPDSSPECLPEFSANGIWMIDAKSRNGRRRKRRRGKLVVIYSCRCCCFKGTKVWPWTLTWRTWRGQKRCRWTRRPSWVCTNRPWCDGPWVSAAQPPTKSRRSRSGTDYPSVPHTRILWCNS